MQERSGRRPIAGDLNCVLLAESVCRQPTNLWIDSHVRRIDEESLDLLVSVAVDQPRERLIQSSYRADILERCKAHQRVTITRDARRRRSRDSRQWRGEC